MSDVIWNIYVELRKELIEAQKIRAQILGFKFAFISASFGVIVVKLDTFDSNILVLPALSAIFFDFIIYSYSFSIKRIGHYIKEQIEPVLEKDENVPEGFIMWQKYLLQPKTRQYLSAYGNIGVTFLSILVGIIGLLKDFRPFISSVLVFVLLVFAIMDIKAYREPKKLGILLDDGKGN
ncbi:MAG: hypothetical protein JXB49_27850 [Bacteroidales bacterium]|nr:hypothetical protein [Bacteroidales bacterium]